MFDHATLSRLEAAAGPLLQTAEIDYQARADALQVALVACRGDFARTQFADTLETMLSDLARGPAYIQQVLFVDLQGFAARAADWLNIEMPKRKRLTVYKVQTPLGEFSVMAKSFMGARFAAGEKAFNEPHRNAQPRDLMHFAKALRLSPVSLCIHAFHYISEAEATKKEPTLPALELSVITLCHDWMMRHWEHMASDSV